LLLQVLPPDNPAWTLVTTSVKAVPFLESLPDTELLEVARSLELVEFGAGEIIIYEVDSGADGLYIVWEGTAQAEKGGESVHEYTAGDHFGELALLSGRDGSQRKATVRARGGHSQAPRITHCLRLRSEKFRTLSSMEKTLAVVAQLPHQQPQAEVRAPSRRYDRRRGNANILSSMSVSGNSALSGQVQVQWRGKGGFGSLWAQLALTGILSFQQHMRGRERCAPHGGSGRLRGWPAE
jgi:hypothetical protein